MKIKPHQHKGSIDDDCEECGCSIYMKWHTDGFSETEVGQAINRLVSRDPIVKQIVDKLYGDDPCPTPPSNTD